MNVLGKDQTALWYLFIRMSIKLEFAWPLNLIYPLEGGYPDGAPFNMVLFNSSIDI